MISELFLPLSYILNFKKMKKLILLILSTCSLIAFQQESSAQLQKGNTLIGANADLFKLGFGFGTTSNINFNIAPRIGYFVQNNIALGGFASLGVDKYKGTDAVYNYRLNAFGRYYIPKAEVYNPLNDGRFFLEGQAGIGGQTGIPFGFNISAAAGYAYFVSSTVAIEGMAVFHSIFGAGANMGLEARLGFSIYLPSKKLSDEYRKVKEELAPGN